MSAPFFKIVAFVIIGHAIILSVLWVGFPVPLARPAAMFFYAGSAPAADTVVKSQGVEGGQAGVQVPFDPSASYFKNWIELRNPSKPTQYDYLGF
jgi:hypothetical protein